MKKCNDATPIFLLGSGRSGTTLIQRLLNSYEDVMIWGEHAGFLKHISASYYLLKNSPSMHEFVYSNQPNNDNTKLSVYYKNPKLWQAWINWYERNDLKTLYRVCVENYFNNITVGKFNKWGFKEIRYGEDDNVIEFLHEIFPEAKFLIITRNGFNVLESQLTTFHKGNSKYKKIRRLLQLKTLISICIKWRKQNNYYLNLLSKRNSQFIHVRYDDIVTDRAYLSSIFQNIGLDVGKKQYQILEMKDGRGSAINDNTNIHNRWKRMGIIPYSIANMIIGDVNEKLQY